MSGGTVPGEVKVTSARDFGSLLRGYRQRALLTQEELAARTGVSTRTIRRLESNQLGRPRTATVRALAAQLGLGAAEQATLLGADPEAPVVQVASDGPRRTEAAPEPPIPAQLPMDAYGFTGRDEQLDALDAFVAAAGEQTTALLISAIGGTAGIGKTALAVHWAHRVADRFPDGQLYVNMRAFAPTGAPVQPHEAVRGFLEALGVPPSRIPAGPDAQVALYRSRLAAKRELVVLDNARDAEQVRPLLPGAPGCAVVVTSRNQLTSLVAAEGAHLVDLDVLAPGEARQLLVRRIGPVRAAAEPEAVDALVAACCGLPLALTIVAARAVVQPARSLADLAAELAGARNGLDALSAGDAATDVRAVFSWSYRAVTPGAARLFRLLGLHRAPDIGVDAAAGLAGLVAAEVRPLLAELTRAHLVGEHVPGRFGFHDLLRAYAGELARRTDPDDARRAAVRRLLDHYVERAGAADRLLDPGEGAGAGPAGREAALAWFATEHAALLAAVDQAAASGLDAHTVQLAQSLYSFLDQRGHWHDLVRVQRAATGAAHRLGDPTTESRAHRNLAAADIRLGRFDDARDHLRDAIELAARAGDVAAQAGAHYNLAYLWDQQRDYHEALRENERAMALYEAAGHRRGQARSLAAAGWYRAQFGEHRTAIAMCRQAIPLFEEIGDGLGLAGTLDTIGLAHRNLGEFAEALASYRRAIEISRELGSRYYEGVQLAGMGDAYLALGDRDAAREAWSAGLAILDDLHHPDADDVRQRLAGLG
jgi:tetratricopeptide (TPR) repeat protein/transcriptional regulator with XRE-family HTH domain